MLTIGLSAVLIVTLIIFIRLHKRKYKFENGSRGTKKTE